MARRDLGGQLAELLRRLRANNSPVFSISAREEIDAFRLAFHLVKREPVADLPSLADYFAPLLARTPNERSAFDILIKGVEIAPEPTPVPPPKQQLQPEIEKPNRWQNFRDWIILHRRGLAAAILLLLFASLILVQPMMMLQAPPRPAPSPSPTSSPAAAETPTAGEQPQIAEPAPGDATQGIEPRVREVAARFNGAPTLREFATALSANSKTGIQPGDYLRRLQGLTGFAADRPLGLLEPAPHDVRDLAMLIWAAGEVEAPSDRSLASVINRMGRQNPPGVSSLLPLEGPGGLWSQLPGGTLSPASVVARFRQLAGQTDKSAQPDEDPVLALDDAAMARLIAVDRPDWTPTDAPWLPQPVQSSTTPAWVAWLAATLLLAVLARALLPLLDPRRAFLRRRPPRFRPHRTQLVNETANTPLGPPATFRDAHKALQRRDSRAVRTLDIRATIRATIAAGGLPTLRSQRLAMRPDYLVLIEQQGPFDLEAQRAMQLIAPLRTGAIGVSVYFFRGEPSLLRDENDGRVVTIEELIARYPNHRLMLVTAGQTMLDLFSGELRRGFAKLSHWRRRGLLTPVPLAQWAREERLIGRGFAAPVARSTGTGLLALARFMSQETPPGAHLVRDGDEGVAALPPALERLLVQAGAASLRGDDEALDQLVVDLAWYPDRAGFEWLCALAVYPLATYDIALYLGTRLPEQVDKPEGPKLFTPARLAALTRLEWLRTGGIPDPIRRRLIDRLSPQRAAQIRALIAALIKQSEAAGREPAPGRASYGREASEGPPPGQIWDDEVLIDFMRGREASPLEVALPPIPPRTLRERLDQIDWVMVNAITIVVGYALATWYAVPGTQDDPGDLTVWMPVLAVSSAALVAMLMLRSATVWLRLRDAAWQFTTGGLVLAVLAAVALAGRELTAAGSLLPGSAGSMLGYLTLALCLWPSIWWMIGRLGDPWRPRMRAGSIARLAVQAVVGSAVAIALVSVARSLGAASPYALTVLMGGGVAVSVGAARVRPIGPTPAHADLVRLRTNPTAWRNLPFAVAAVLLVAALLLTQTVRSGRETLPLAATPDRVIATSRDALIAATEGDGQSIIVVDASAPSTVLKRVRMPDRNPPARRIAALAVARGAAGSEAVRIGYATAYDGSSTAQDALVTPPTAAFGDDGVLGYVGQRADGRAIVHVDFANGTAAGAYIPVRATAIAAGEGGCFLWSMANGQVGAAVFSGSGPDRVRALARLPHGPYEPMAGGARIIRAMPSVTAGVTQFILVADDGSAARVLLDCKRGYAMRRIASIPALAVGPVILWRRRTVATPVQTRPVQAAPAQIPSAPSSGSKGPPSKIAQSVTPTPPPPPTPTPTPTPTIAACEAGSPTTSLRDLRSGLVLASARFWNVSARAMTPQADPRIAAIVSSVSADNPQADAVVRALAAVRDDAGLTTNERLAAFLALVAADSGFRVIEESFAYGTNLTEVFPRFFPTPESTKGFVGNPERIANCVYANRLGNGDAASGDGWKYRGRGFLQTSGHDDYAAKGRELGVDLIANPDLMLDPNLSARAAAIEWQRIQGNRGADVGDLVAPYRRHVGGMARYTQFQAYYEQFSKILMQYKGAVGA